jgi:hypothetical protein
MLRPAVLPTLVLAVLVLTGCAGDGDGGAAPAPSAATTPASPGAAPSATPVPSVTPDDAQVVSVTVAGGQVSGDTGRVEVALGTTVRLTVTSDAADEVHVHGFDLSQAVTPGQSMQLEFVADQAGIFEVELHDARTVLTRLQVS